MEALLVLTALVLAWLAGLLTLVWMVPGLLVVLIARGAAERHR